MKDPASLPVLYVSYSGLLEPLGQSQVLPYVRGLAQAGQAMILLSYEKPAADNHARSLLRTSLDRAGVRWVALRYHRRPRVLSTLFDVALGVLCALWLGRHGLRLIHARAHVPAAVALVATAVLRIPFLFDHRGLMAEEFADAGIWPRGGFLYRWTTRLERVFLRRAKAVVVLTERLAEELQARGPVAVIPCAVDLDRYRPADSSEPEYDLVYAGSWTGLYLVEETLRFFAAFRVVRPGARLLILTADPVAKPVFADGIEFLSVPPSAVPHFLSRARAGISLRRPGRAQIAASPVKISEYWACGLPVVTSPGVGDVDKMVEQHRAGIILRGFLEEDLRLGALALVQLLAEGTDMAHRCRRLAEERFDLKRAAAAYGQLYALGEHSSCHATSGPTPNNADRQDGLR